MSGPFLCIKKVLSMIVMKFYNGAIMLLVILGAASLALMTVGIIGDVVLRNLGLHSIQALSALVEYCLLFSTMAVAPYLVRTHGHVAVQSFVETMPSALRNVVSQIGLVLSVALLALLSWRAAVIAVEVSQGGSIDMRSINIPGWVLYMMLSVGFGLMAIEFLILLLRGERFRGSHGEG